MLLQIILKSFSTVQGLCVIIPCALFEIILAGLFLFCVNERNRKGALAMVEAMKTVAIVPVLWLSLVLMIGLAPLN